MAAFAYVALDDSSIASHKGHPCDLGQGCFPSGAAIERLKEKLLLTNHECWYLRTFFLKVKKEAHVSGLIPKRTSGHLQGLPRLIAMLFYSNFTFEQMALNMHSRLVITFLSESKRLLISWLQSPSAVIL